MKNFIWLLLMAAVVVACSSGTNLSKEEKMKLDPSLQRLLLEDDVPDTPYNVKLNAHGHKTYGVIIRCDNPTDLETAGIFINSIHNDIVTAKLTVAEIRKIAALSSVTSISNSSKSYPK